MRPVPRICQAWGPFKNNQVSNGAYGYLAPSVITSLTRVVRSYARADSFTPTLVGPKMNYQNLTSKLKRKEIGPPPNRPTGTDCSANRATVAPSSKQLQKVDLTSRAKQVAAGAKARLVTKTTAVLVTGPSTSKYAAQQTTIQTAGVVPAGSIATASSGTERWPLPRVVDPAKAVYQDRRNAARLLRKVSETPPEEHELTPELKEAIERAKAIIPDFNPDFKPVQPAPKRQRSLEDKKPIAKRRKTVGVLPRKSFAEIVKDRIIIGVLDENHPEGIIPKAQWKWVEAELTKVALKIILDNPGPPPVCEDLGWHQGQIKIISCEDERSVQLYKTAISKVGEVYPNAKLVVVDRKDIPSRPRARVWVPSTVEDPNEIMQLIRVCNPEIPTQGWKFVKIDHSRTSANESEEQKRATMQVLLLLTEDSIEPLAKRGGELRYGFVKIKVRVYKTDTEAIEHLATKEDTEPMSEPEPMSEAEPMSEGEPLTEEDYASSGSELGLGRMYFEREGKCSERQRKFTERELLCENKEDPDITITEDASSSDQPPPL